MAYGITSTGFNRKRLADILTELEADFKTIFGDNLNVDPESPDGQLLGLLAKSYADLWELTQFAYNSFNPNAATKASLSNLVQLNAILRKAESSSTVELSATGTNGTTITAGSIVSTDDDIQWTIDSDVVIAAGVATLQATAVVAGPISSVAGTITNIDTPITGWSTVTNVADAVVGVEEEKDPELRSRRERSIEAAASSIVESILSAILEIEEVTDAIVYENDTTTTDAMGIPAHGFLAIVEGGDDDEIAEAIFNKKPIGITSNGTTTVAVEDSQGLNHDIKFSRPSSIVVHVKVTLSTGDTYAGDDAVKQAIVDFASDGLTKVDSETLEETTIPGFGLGQDVIYSRMYVPLNQTNLGISEVTDLRIDVVDPPTGVATIDIDFDEQSSFLVANIDIVQV